MYIYTAYIECTVWNTSFFGPPMCHGDSRNHCQRCEVLAVNKFSFRKHSVFFLDTKQKHSLKINFFCILCLFDFKQIQKQIYFLNTNYIANAFAFSSIYVLKYIWNEYYICLHRTKIKATRYYATESFSWVGTYSKLIMQIFNFKNSLKGAIPLKLPRPGHLGLSSGVCNPVFITVSKILRSFSQEGCRKKFY